MNMQKNGSNRVRLLRRCGTAVVAPFILIFLWATYAILAHELTMMRFAREFARIEHPQGSYLVTQDTHFGDGPYRMGSGNEMCYSYVAEIRTIPNTFEEVERYYEEHAPNPFLQSFSGATIEVMPVSREGMARSRDYPVRGWIEEYLASDSGAPAYIIYGTKIDEHIAGDFRCWEI